MKTIFAIFVGLVVFGKSLSDSSSEALDILPLSSKRCCFNCNGGDVGEGGRGGNAALYALKAAVESLKAAHELGGKRANATKYALKAALSAIRSALDSMRNECSGDGDRSSRGGSVEPDEETQVDHRSGAGGDIGRSSRGHRPQGRGSYGRRGGFIKIIKYIIEKSSSSSSLSSSSESHEYPPKMPNPSPTPSQSAATISTLTLLSSASGLLFQERRPSTPISIPSTPSTSTSTSATTKKPCPVGGTWSAWAVTSPCGDCRPKYVGICTNSACRGIAASACGACCRETTTRTCTSAAWGCPCTGDTRQTNVCNRVPCQYPFYSCCQGTVRSIAGGPLLCQ